MRPVVLACLFGLSACVLDQGSSPDAASYDVPDAAPYPGFRDAGCRGGPSGTSGGGSGLGCVGDGGTVPPPTPDAAPPDATPCDYVTFTYVDASATTVWVSGDWNGWAETPMDGALVLSESVGDVFTGSTRIGPGKHHYKLIIDGTTWILDPGNPESEVDEDGNENSVLEVCTGVM